MNKLDRKYMNDFANLLVALDDIKKRIEAVEKLLPILNAIYFEEKSNEDVVIAK